MSDNHFLVLDKNDQGEATVTIAAVAVTKGNTRRALRRFRQSIEDRGMWCTPIHPTAAKVLMDALRGTAEVITETGVRAEQVADACRAEESK